MQLVTNEVKGTLVKQVIEQAHIGSLLEQYETTLYENPCYCVGNDFIFVCDDRVVAILRQSDTMPEPSYNAVYLDELR